RRRRDHFRERAKVRDQGLGKRFDIPPWNGAKQHELEQLVVAESIRAGIPEALPQPFAMTVKMRCARRDRCPWGFRHGMKISAKMRASCIGGKDESRLNDSHRL